MLFSHPTSAFASTSTSKFNIASIVMQMQMHLQRDSDTNADIKCEQALRYTSVPIMFRIIIQNAMKCCLYAVSKTQNSSFFITNNTARVTRHILASIRSLSSVATPTECSPVHQSHPSFLANSAPPATLTRALSGVQQTFTTHQRY